MTESPGCPVDPLADRLAIALRELTAAELDGVVTLPGSLRTGPPSYVAVFEALALIAARERDRRGGLLRAVERDLSNDRTTAWWGDPDQAPEPVPEDEGQRPDDN